MDIWIYWRMDVWTYGQKDMLPWCSMWLYYFENSNVQIKNTGNLQVFLDIFSIEAICHIRRFVIIRFVSLDVLSLYVLVVIGPPLTILRQRRWSLLYDVYWLDFMMVIVNRWQVLLIQRDQNTWTWFRIRNSTILINNNRIRHNE